MLIQPKKLKSKVFSRLVMVAIIVLFLVFGIFTLKEIANKTKLDKEITELNQELEKLKLKNQDFLTLIDQYESDFFVEQQARTKMNMKKPGEKVVVVHLDNVNKMNSDNIIQEVEDNNQGQIDQPLKSNVILWWNYFFGDKQNL